MKKNAKSIPVGMLCAMFSAGLAMAAELPKEGTYDITSCFSGMGNNIDFSKGNKAGVWEMLGTSVSNPPGGLFDNNSIRCVGLSTTLQGKYTFTSVCEAVDNDGDKRLSYFNRNADGTITRTNVTGTGKYDGMVASGEQKPMGPFPDNLKPGNFQTCNRQMGTYKLK